MTPPDTATLEAPEIDIMAAAIAADNETAASTSPAPAAKETTPAAPDKTGTPPAVGTEATAPAASATAEADKPKGKETPFTKAKGEAERRDRSWKALEEEKATVRADKARAEAEAATLRREMETLRNAQPVGPTKDEHGATAEDYRGLAKRYRAEGNDELAEAAQARAEKLATTASRPAAASATTFDSPEFQAQWKGHTEKLIASDPTLADPENAVVKAANTILKDPTYGRFFKSHPDGINAAVEVARLLQANAAGQQTRQALTTTQADLTKAKAEVTRLTALLQPRGSHPAGQPGGGQKIEDMNPNDAAAAVMAMARAADRGELN